jgi:NAD(P)H-dependent flavin oxidoreductase YrpB (nitropropane dioxygenase family)
VSALGCEVPVMQAPLGRGAAARLARAVSQAGGLGTLGASWTEPAILREQIRSIARATDGLFCVNLVLDFEQDERLGVADEERVPWVSFSFGLRPELVTRAGAGAGAPEGRSNHFALEANGEIQVFDVWESQEAFGATLLPNMAELGADPGQPMVARGHNVIDG